MSKIKEYSETAIAIDLISDAYNTTNPIIIAEKAEEDLGVSLTIHQVMDYYDINKIDYEKESMRHEYRVYY